MNGDTEPNSETIQRGPLEVTLAREAPAPGAPSRIATAVQDVLEATVESELQPSLDRYPEVREIGVGGMGGDAETFRRMTAVGHRGALGNAPPAMTLALVQGVVLALASRRASVARARPGSELRLTGHDRPASLPSERRMPPCAFLLACLLSAGPAGAETASAPASSLPDGAQRARLFRSLVEAARSQHVFSAAAEKSFGRTFDEELPGLEQEFARAESQAALVAAVNHFQNALHDGHCRYNPPDRPQPLTAGFVASVEREAQKVRFWVSEVLDPTLAASVEVGDLVVEVDGVPSERFLEAFRLESNASQPRAAAEDIALFLGRRDSPPAPVQEGTPVSLVFAKRSTGKRVAVTRRWQPAAGGPSKPESSAAIDYRLRCANLPARNYGPYELTDLGVNFCLYTSRVAPFDAYPVVRHFSFSYETGRPTGHQSMRVDHALLASRLAAMPKAKGVVLDLRDNRGGNNPNWFFDWWAPAPYVDGFVEILLRDDFADRKKLEKARVTGWGSDELQRYLAALASRKPGERFLRRPFFCRNEACDGDNRYVPSHQVTSLPRALLVGPGCVSSCDAFALTFKENGFGPLVGEPPAAAFTSFRTEHRVEVPETRLDLGFVRFALSRDLSGATGQPVEGRTLEMDVLVERRFENASRYDALLVEAAVKALRAAKPASVPAAPR